MQHTPSFLKIVEDAKTRIHEIDVNALKQLMKSGEPYHLLDVREDNEWAKGGIPTATHMGKGVLEMNVEKSIPDFNAKIIVYCGGGFRSALAADNLQKMGYTNVLSLAGGYHAWTTSG